MPILDPRHMRDTSLDGLLQPPLWKRTGLHVVVSPPTFNIRIQRWAKGGRSYTRHAWTVLAETDNDLATPFLPYRMWWALLNSFNQAWHCIRPGAPRRL